MKSANFKRLLAMILVVVMVLSFVACGNSSNSTGTSTAASTVEQTAAESSVEPAFDPTAKYEPAITLKVAAGTSKTTKFNPGETIEKNVWKDLYASNGINMEEMWIVDETQGELKMKTAIASGDYPDVFQVNAQDYITYSNNGVIADITENFDKYLTDKAKEYFNADGGYGLKSANVNGKLYGLPSVSSALDSIILLWLRTDWLKNVNMQAPKTIDELVKLAEAFTTQDPDKNGKNDTYGLALNGKALFDAVGGVQSFFASYGVHPGVWSGEYSWVKDPAGSGIIWGGDSPNAKVALAKLQEMYKAGYISKSFGVQDAPKNLEDMVSGKAGMAFAPMWGSMWLLDVPKRNKNADFMAVPLPSGDSSAFGKSFVPNTTANYWVVSSKCKNPEALYKLFNITYDIYTSEDLAVHDKYMGSNEGKDEFKLSAMRPFAPNKNYENYLKLSKAVVSKDTAGLNAEQLSNYTTIMKYLDPLAAGTYDNLNGDQNAGWQFYKVFAAPDSGFAAIDQIVKANNCYEYIAYNAPNTKLMGEKYPTLDKLVKETIVKIIYGNAPLTDYDKMIENWKKLGGDEITKEANDWYSKNAK